MIQLQSLTEYSTKQHIFVLVESDSSRIQLQKSALNVCIHVRNASIVIHAKHVSQPQGEHFSMVNVFVVKLDILMTRLIFNVNNVTLSVINARTPKILAQIVIQIKL